MGYILQKPAFSVRAISIFESTKKIYKSGTLVNKEVSNFTLINFTRYQMSTQTVKEIIKNGVFAMQFYVESQQASN
jgi:hypothetical protein